MTSQKAPQSVTDGRLFTLQHLSPEARRVFEAMLALSETERAAIMVEFCECGSTDLRCQCWNDE